MKRILLTTLFIIIASMTIFGPIFSQTENKKSNGNSKAEQEVLKALDEVIRAMVEHDMPAIERIYTDNYVFSGANGGSTSRTQLIEAFKRMKTNGASYISWEPSEMRISIYGDAAVTNCRFAIKTLNGKGEVNTLNHRYTCNWVKQKGRWMLAAAHASEIKPPALPAQQ
jgi:ketosteroid isomerase-like protein